MSAAQKIRIVLVCGVGAILALQVFAVGAAGLLLSIGKPEEALAFWPDSAEAASKLGENLASAGEIDRAQAMAIHALRLSPDSRALRTLARIAEARGQRDIAATATVISAHLGWRDGLAQWWIFQRALGDHDVSAAALAGDALLRTNFRPEAVRKEFTRMLSSAEGRKALAERMSAKPAWSSPFISTFRSASGEQVRFFGLLLYELDALGVRPSDDLVRPFFEDAIRRGEIGHVLAIWRQLYPQGIGDPATGLLDGDFSEFASRNRPWGPFGWREHDSTNAALRVPSRSEFGNDPALEVAVEGALASRPISQLLALPPGSYLLEYDAKLDRGSRYSFQWQIVCLGARIAQFQREAIAEAREGWSRHSMSFAIPEHGCNGQTLWLVAGPARRGGALISIDAMRIRSAD